MHLEKLTNDNGVVRFIWVDSDGKPVANRKPVAVYLSERHIPRR